MNDKRFFSLEEAAPYYGYHTANALRMAFRRGTFPKQFLKRMGKRKILVDCPSLDAWIGQRDSKMQQGELFA